MKYFANCKFCPSFDYVFLPRFSLLFYQVKSDKFFVHFCSFTKNIETNNFIPFSNNVSNAPTTQHVTWGADMNHIKGQSGVWAFENFHF